SIWIAQSEGRAKDGLDNTDPAIVKMFALAKRKEPLANTVASLNIIPVSISYEFDPCDYLKAKERYAIDAEGSYDKPSGEDLLSLVKGLGEFKGRVHLNFGEKIHGDFETAEEVANALDRQILENYQLYQVNYWALKLLAQQDSSGPFYDTWQALGASVSFSDTSEYEKRMDTCEQIWRRKWLEMYANPVVNKHMSRCSHLTPI
ncbi:MAG: glycerol acyltransferase, partial [Pseudomonadales bacterium]|nr:glycerol acyltransferase [Pseudomonadales bacterium]